jgi:hypothetical protein
LCVGGILPALSMMHFQWRAWGNPLLPGHRFLENPSFRAQSEEGFYGATKIDWSASQQLLFDRGFGLVPLTPLLGVALLGAVIALRSPRLRARALASLGVATTTFVAISFMNNWRGGWTIGPRYLAVVVPFLGWLALIGLDALAGFAIPIAFGVALASTVIALLLSGTVSAYYPHVPEPMSRPVRDLVEPLVRYDFAPHNAANLFGLYGTASMWPWALLMLLVIATLVRHALRQNGLLSKLATFACAAVLGGLFGFAFLSDTTETNHARGALALVTQRWEPSGHDALSTLLREEPVRRDAAWERRVMATYRALGREKEAREFENARRARMPRGRSTR